VLPPAVTALRADPTTSPRQDEHAQRRFAVSAEQGREIFHRPEVRLDRLAVALDAGLLNLQVDEHFAGGLAINL